MKAPEILLWTATAFLSLSFSQGQGSVTQTQGQLEKLGGQTVTLECTFSTGYQYYYLFWYRQQQSGTVDFLFRINYSNDEKNGAGRRFSAQFRKSSKFFSLTIKELEPMDSAMYFCALWGIPWGDIRTDKLIFGKGTTVTVEPKNPEPSSPSVFVVKSANAKPSDGNKLTAACLVKDFFPKNIKVNMSQETDTVYKSKEGILSSNGKYSMIQVVKVEPNEDVGCYVTHEGINYNQTKPQSAPTTAPINNTQVCESSNSMVEEPNMEKVNMLSVTVLGLRVLLAKSIAFNMLMTVKLFIF